MRLRKANAILFLALSEERENPMAQDVTRLSGVRAGSFSLRAAILNPLSEPGAWAPLQPLNCPSRPSFGLTDPKTRVSYLFLSVFGARYALSHELVNHIAGIEALVDAVLDER